MSDAHAFNIEVFRQTCRIIDDESYELPDGRQVVLPYSRERYAEAIYLDAAYVDDLIANPTNIIAYREEGSCVVDVRNADSYSEALRLTKQAWGGDTPPREASRCHDLRGRMKPVLVLGFANPNIPGGGVKSGASNQEEGLCRRSTLHASLTSDGARGFYDANKSAGYGDCAFWGFTDGMILSPCVDVFRDVDGSLLETPYRVAVLTVPAPIVETSFHKLTPAELELLEGIIRHRIEGMLCVAMHFDYSRLVLGAWGCGGFRNDPDMMSKCFAKAIEGMVGASHDGMTKGPGWESIFDHISFAVLDRSRDGRRIHAFEKNMQRLTGKQGPETNSVLTALTEKLTISDTPPTERLFDRAGD